MKRILVALTVLIFASSVSAAVLTTPSTTVRRIYLDNGFLSVHVLNHPTLCPWGFISSEGDAAFDRWISLLMMAYNHVKPVTISYNDSAPTQCKIVAVAVGTIP
jgi:hypothetical protein